MSRTHRPSTSAPKTSWPTSVLILSGVLVGILGLGARLGFSAISDDDARLTASLEKRAQRVYSFDRAHAASARALPPNRVRALSMALYFGDRSGAEIVLVDLEKRIAR